MQSDRGGRGLSAAFCCLLVIVLACPTFAATPSQSLAGDSSSPKSHARQLTAQIDQAVDAGWKSVSLEPTVGADDAEFMRRLYLDLAGKIPSVTQTREFLSDKRPDKRERLVDELLASAIYAAHFANNWRDILLAGTNPELRTSIPELESWLRLRFVANTPYNQIAAELISASLPASPRRAARITATIPSPMAYFQANERKPENLAASMSSVFLGVQVECAQCHDHPFAKWKQGDFWSLAAFFRGLDARSTDMTTLALEDNFDRSGLPIPGGEATAVPRFLDGSSPAWRPEVGNRATLAQWVTRADNPYFARAAVNLVWEQFFGHSLARPSDAAESSPAAHVELLDALAAEFVASRYDMKELIRAIVLSRAYQLSSRTTTPESAPTGYFACMPVRRLTADQLFDSLVQATGFYEAPPPRAQQLLAPDSARADFRNKFAEEGRQRGESQTSIVQALALMNGKLVSDATSLERSKTLIAAIKMPHAELRERLEMLFFASLGRPPNDEEAEEFTAYVKAGEEQARLTDVFWVLLNSAEFASNH